MLTLRYPDPVWNPGYTYSADCHGVDIKMLWAPESDERERINYIFYYPAEGLALTNVSLYGQRGCIRKGCHVVDTSEDRFVELFRL